MIAFPPGMTSQQLVETFATNSNVDAETFSVALLVAEMVKMSKDPDKTTEQFGDLVRPIRHDVGQYAMVIATMSKLIASLEAAQEAVE